MEWAAEHQAELAEDWRLASSGEPIVKDRTPLEE
jgi:hypothetical protein